MRAISLFSGVGGFELGFERTGIETVLQAERDPWCLTVLERQWPGTERVTDVRDVGAGGAGACVDLVYGGFPCQDLSVAGKRAGLGGERSNLWHEFRRVVSELRPAWCVVENVPGLHSSSGGEDFTVVATGLVELGYGVAWRILDAKFYGVPQRRRRVFVVAAHDAVGRAGAERAATVLALCESCGGNPAAGRAAGEGPPGALAIRTANTGSNGWGIGLNEQAYTLDGTKGQAVIDLAPALSASGRGTSRAGESRGQDPLVVTGVPDLAYALAARNAKQVSLLDGQDTFITTDGVRRLTPRECERLQGWPDDHTRWTAGGRQIADSHRYRMVGNGVVAPVAEWIGHRLVAVDEQSLSKEMTRVKGCICTA